MAFLVAFTSVVVVSLVTSAPVENNGTVVPDSGEDTSNSPATSDVPEVTTATEVPDVTIFRTDKRSDKEKFLEAVRSARKLWNGDYMYQRDIRITRAQLAQIYGVDTSKDETSYAWPNATVPFSFGRKVHGFAREIRDAMRQWEQETCVRFVEKTKNTGNTDHVRFVQSRWAYSYLGKQGGAQKLGIPSKFFPDTRYVHLLGHALGLRHTHANSDRDTLYHVAWDTVPERYRYNFDHESPAYGPRTKIAPLESEFEFDWSSVMADESESVEGDVDFTPRDRRAVYPSDPFYLYRTTSTERASFLEYKKINQLYNCSERCANVNSSRCQHGGYLGPKCNCVCPPGTVGDHCEHRTTNAKKDICGEVLQENKTLHYVSQPSSYHCTWWIRAPRGGQVSVTFTDFSADNSTHSVGSCDLYFELRNHDLYKGEKYCWYELPLDEPLFAKEKDFLVDYFGSKDANFNFTLTATVYA
uniref:Metalloendopeptidase n=1 Tax=Rhipicephalus appendiculatus TaxID=34631 RepID=A0A131YK19_RHIAP